MEILVAPLALLTVFAFVLWVRRQSELCWISIRCGRLLVVRGRVPQGLVGDFRPLLVHVKRGEVFVHKTSSGGSLQTRGIDEATTQRLRNVLGIKPETQLVSATPIRNPNLGQRLGIGWLAWWSAKQ